VGAAASRQALARLRRLSFLQGDSRIAESTKMEQARQHAARASSAGARGARLALVGRAEHLPAHRARGAQVRALLADAVAAHHEQRARARRQLLDDRVHDQRHGHALRARAPPTLTRAASRRTPAGRTRKASVPCSCVLPLLMRRLPHGIQAMRQAPARAPHASSTSAAWPRAAAPRRASATACPRPRQREPGLPGSPGDNGTSACAWPQSRAAALAALGGHPHAQDRLTALVRGEACLLTGRPRGAVARVRVGARLGRVHVLERAVRGVHEKQVDVLAAQGRVRAHARLPAHVAGVQHHLQSPRAPDAASGALRPQHANTWTGPGGARRRRARRTAGETLRVRWLRSNRNMTAPGHCRRGPRSAPGTRACGSASRQCREGAASARGWRR